MNQAFKDNLNASSSMVNTSVGCLSSGKRGGVELYSKILQEKENYISRLENEINEMRKEGEVLREKLIMCEIGVSGGGSGINGG